MRRNLWVLLMVSVLIFSCSSDKNEEDLQGVNAIVGSWQLTGLKIDNATASDNAKYGKQILDFLTAKECYILSFVFTEDLTILVENAVNYIEVNATLIGLDIPCPTESDSDSSAYTYDGKVLTYVGADGETVTVNATVNGTVLTIDAAGLDIPNFNSSGELIFEKK
ncbi:MAG: hypothetical protein QM485_06960 [Flavobacteriaceae bacterium]